MDAIAATAMVRRSGEEVHHRLKMYEWILIYLIIGQLLLLFGLYWAPQGEWAEATGHSRFAHVFACALFVLVWPITVFFFKKSHGRSRS